MKIPSFLPRGKTSWACISILWLALFVVLVGVVQIHAQTKQVQKDTAQAQTQPITLKIFITKEHRENFRTLKKYLNTLKPERGDIKKYGIALDSLLAIKSTEQLDTIRLNEFRKKALRLFGRLDSKTRLKIYGFVATLAGPCYLTPATLEAAGISCKGDSLYMSGTPAVCCCGSGGVCCPCVDCYPGWISTSLY